MVTNIFQRLLRIQVAALFLVTGFAPQAVHAATYSGGGGILGNPYLVSTVQDLEDLGNPVNNGDWDKHFLMTQDIDMSTATSFAPIGGASTKFTGVFDGGGYAIQSFTLNLPAQDYIAVFGYVDNSGGAGTGEISNLGVEGGAITGRWNVGGLAAWNDGTLTNCHATVSVTSTQHINGYSRAGGLVGWNGTGTVTSSYATGDVAGAETLGGLIGGAMGGSVTGCYATGNATCLVGSGRYSAVGGLIGGNNGATAITSCYATGNVSGNTSRVGGLIGFNLGSSPVTRCYATGSVTGGTMVGGLIGDNQSGTITDCFAMGAVIGSTSSIGGLVGSNGDTITNCYAIGTATGTSNIGGLVGSGGTATASFWDSTLGGPDNGIGTAKSTGEMMQQTTFTPWDFTTVWAINEGVSYPWLQASGPPVVPGNYALRFDGADDFVRILSPTGTPSGDNSYTMEVWCKADVWEVLADESSHLVSVSDTSGSKRCASIAYHNVTWYGGGRPVGMYVDHYSSDWFTGKDVVIGQWYHFAATYDGAEERFYVNGQFFDSHALSSLNVDSSPMVIGAEAWDGLPSSLFDGIIDEVRIWDHARSDGEIAADYSHQLVGNEPGLVAYYTFDEGTGQVLGDATSNGNNGELGTTPGSDANDPVWVPSSAPFLIPGGGAPPQVYSAAATDSTTVRVVFDEAMTDNAALVDPANYTFTGSVALTATSVARVDGTTVDVTVNEMTDGAAYTTHVETGASGPTDLAANHVDPAHNSAGFTGIGVAPQVSSAAAMDSTTVRVVFDEDMTDDAALVNAANYTFTGGGAALTATSVVRIDATTVDVSVNEMTDGAAYTAHVETGASGPTDLAATHVDPAHNSAGFTGIGVAPQVSSAAAMDSTTVRVVFDEDMTDDAALVNAANYTFTGGGVALTASGVARVNATTVNVTINEMTDGAAYTVYVETGVGGPLDLASHYVDPSHNGAGFTGMGMAPEVSSATATDNTTVRVVFSEAMTNDAALVNTANYTFTGGGVPLTAASVARVDASTVAVTINEMTGGVGYTIHVETGLSGPTDLVSNHIDPAHNGAGFTGGGDPPHVVSATTVGSTTVQVLFNEPMTDDGALIALANYTFTGGGVALTASSVLRVGEAAVDVTVNEMTDGAAYTAHVATGPAGPTDLVLNHVDPANNSAGFTGIGIDPVVSIDSVSPPYARDGVTVTVELTATDNVAVVGNPSVTLNGNPMVCQGNLGDMYTYAHILLGGSSEGTATIFVFADDAAANWGYDIDTTSLVIDNTPPTATISLLTTSPTGADAVDFEVAFDEAVTPPFDAGDVSLTGTLAGSVGISGTDPTYTVTVTLTDPNADGTIGIDVAGAGAVTDLAGNPYAGGSSALCDVFNWNGFTQQPQGARKYAGDAHAFTVVADCGASGLSYQWKWDDGAKAVHDVGTDAASYAIPDVTGQAGDYWCEVAYDGSSYPSAAATLEVEEHLEITVQPVGGSYTVGGSHTFSVGTSGGYTPLTYTWKKDGTTVGTDATLVLEPLGVAHSGDYTVEIIDDNVDVAISSPAAALTVDVGTPVAGLMGLGALAGGLALAGLLAVRRRK